MMITEIAKIAEPYQRFVRTSWDKPHKFWHAFNANGTMISSDVLQWPLSRYDLLADDWVVVEVEEVET